MSYFKGIRDDSWIHDISSKKLVFLIYKSSDANDAAIILTYEDSYDARNNVTQRYKLFTHDWQLLVEGKLFDGGHSGHVASTATQHVIFKSNYWINGDGVNKLGTGKEVIKSNQPS